MAKGGTNLNPGADATLVAAATRAAMANVPKDLSRTFESVARGYDTMMQNIGEAYGEIAKETVTLGKSVVQDAIAYDQNATKGDFYAFNRKITGPLTEEQSGEPGSLITTDKADDPKELFESTTIGDELRRIRKEIYQTGPFGIALTAEDKKKKYALQQEKDQLLSQLAVIDNAENFNNDALKNGTVDLKATGKLNLVAKKALTAYKTKSGIIQDGPYKGYKSVLGKDSNDKLVFKLQDAQGNFVTGMDLDGELTTDGDKAYSIPVDNMGGMLNKSISKEDENAVTKIFRDEMVSRTETYAGNILANKLAPYVESEDNLHSLMHKGLGDNATSFVDDLSNPSVTSAEMYATIGEAKLREIGAVDTDGDDDVDKDDFVGVGNEKAKEQNFKIVRQAVLDKTNKNYNAETTRSLFLDYAKGVGEKMWQYSRKKEGKGGKDGTPPPPIKLPSASGSTYMIPKDEGGGKISNNAITTIMRRISSGESVPADGGGNYVFDKSKNTYVYRAKGEDDIIIPNLDSLLANIYGENYSRSAALQWTQYMNDWDGSQFVTSSQKVKKGGKTGIKINFGKPGEVKVGGGKKDLDNMLSGNYYNVDTFRDLHQEIINDEKFYLPNRQYDDKYIAKKFDAGASDYFEFEAVGQDNNVKVTWKNTTGMEGKSQTFSVNDVSVDDFMKTMTAWMNGQMKLYGQKVLENISKKEKNASDMDVDESIIKG
tara:strand:- start:321 stop:2459 length:2139 start_codon:yes stop_codon:yes gene_type:complete